MTFFENWFHKKTDLSEWEWLQGQKFQPEFLSVLLLESLAKKLEIDPAKLYSLEELSLLVVSELRKQEQGSSQVEAEEMMYSVTEWLSKFVKQKVPISDLQRVFYYYHFFKKEEEERYRDAYYLLMDVSWQSGLEGLFLLFLESELN